MATTFVAVDPPDARAEVQPLVPAGPALFGQAAGDLGTRMAAAVAHVAAQTAGPVLVIGTDVPTLTTATLREAAHRLVGGADAVHGPALDGGYYLIGLPTPDPAAFALDPVLLDPLPDLDTPADAHALLDCPGPPEPIGRLLREGAA